MIPSISSHIDKLTKDLEQTVSGTCQKLDSHNDRMGQFVEQAVKDMDQAAKAHAESTRQTLESIDQGLEQELSKALNSFAGSMASLSGKFVQDYQPLTEELRKVVAYIRDQKASVDFAAGTSGYRYHLCNCSTLQGMKEIGREHRYLATRRQDGRFTVHDLTADPIRTGIVRMNLCSNCISVLKSKNLYTHPFDLARYFKQFDSFTPKTIRKVEQVREIQTYSPKQADYSREYRKACNYQCQICGVNCREHPQMLPMHHIDGNPANNERSNLRILCAECHAAQPLHHHMLKNPEMVRQMTSIRALRRQQALLTVTAAP